MVSAWHRFVASKTGADKTEWNTEMKNIERKWKQIGEMNEKKGFFRCTCYIVIIVVAIFFSFSVRRYWLRHFAMANVCCVLKIENKFIIIFRYISLFASQIDTKIINKRTGRILSKIKIFCLALIHCVYLFAFSVNQFDKHYLKRTLLWMTAKWVFFCFC